MSRPTLTAKDSFLGKLEILEQTFNAKILLKHEYMVYFFYSFILDCPLNALKNVVIIHVLIGS